MLLGGRPVNRKMGKDIIDPDVVDTIIGKDTVINGVLNSSGTLRIDGRLEGEIHHRGDLIIGETAVVVATLVEARNINIAGRVNSPVAAENRLELIPPAQVEGDIKAAILVIAEGATLKGKCEMTSPKPATPSPPRS